MVSVTVQANTLKEVDLTGLFTDVGTTPERATHCTLVYWGSGNPSWASLLSNDIPRLVFNAPSSAAALTQFEIKANYKGYHLSSPASEVSILIRVTV